MKTNPHDLAAAITKREHIAIEAMNGILAGEEAKHMGHRQIAEDAVFTADALIKELNK